MTTNIVKSLPVIPRPNRLPARAGRRQGAMCQDCRHYVIGLKDQSLMASAHQSVAIMHRHIDERDVILEYDS